MGLRPGLGIVLLMLAVLTWLLGFDVLYSLQDEDFDPAAPACARSPHASARSAP